MILENRCKKQIMLVCLMLSFCDLIFGIDCFNIVFDGIYSNCYYWENLNLFEGCFCINDVCFQGNLEIGL